MKTNLSIIILLVFIFIGLLPYKTIAKTSTAAISTPTSDSLALVALYNATNGANWTTTWNLNLPMDTWYGVTLNGNRCVTNLSLSGNNLIGNIPLDIGNLGNLSLLWISSNQLTGSIPSEIGNLSLLSLLDLSSNQLSGNIPIEIGTLNNLSVLGLYSNQLTGNIPPEIGNLGNLSLLWIYSNQLTGSIPSEIGNLSLLSTLRLDDNQFVGLIPKEIGYLPLSTLDLSNNNLSGCYPSSFTNLCGIVFDLLGNPNLPNAGDFASFCNTGYGECGSAYCAVNDSLALVALFNATNGVNWINTWDLNQPMDTWYGVTLNSNRCVIELLLNGNNLIGIIPLEIGNLANLQLLNLSNPFFSVADNQLSGSIPKEIGNLSNLQSLYLEDNQLTGNIPKEIGNLSNLQSLYLADNYISGSLPIEITHLSNLIYLSIGNNDFTGSIPSSVGSLSNLIGLSLSGNLLDTYIPKELGKLNDLEYLYLQNNQFIGNIPIELGTLSNLIVLDISNNNLSGCFHPNFTNFCSINYDFSGNPSLPNFDDFCTNGTGACTPDLVWPGDFNHDGIASPEDALYWGLAAGNTGSIRPNATTVWAGQDSPDWPNSILGINNKYQDGNGNGLVDPADLNALANNMGNTHQLLSATPPSNGIEYRLELVSWTSNDKVVYDVYIDQGGSAPTVHGIAGAIEFPHAASMTVDYSNSSLVPQQTVDKFENNRLEFALTRTDLVDKLCDTPIFRVELEIVIEDELPLGGDGLLFSKGATASANGIINATNPATVYGLSLIPYVPSGTLVTSVDVTHEGCNTQGEASVYAGGLGALTYSWSTGETTSTINNLTAGSYSVTVDDSTLGSDTVYFEVLPFIITYDSNNNPTNCTPTTCFPTFGVSNTIFNNTYQAENILSSNGQIPSGEAVIFKAGESINLNTGFEVELGANFSIEIEDCSVP